MFDLLPYGAGIDLNCIGSSKIGLLVDEYTSATTYTTTDKQIGENTSYFLFSQKEPIEMTYEYSRDNGVLVEIITNLEVITNSNIIEDENEKGHYYIINNDWLKTGEGQFTISNANWFNSERQEEPYIRLCFNNVQVECCFTNPLGGQVTYGDNGWEGLLDQGINVLVPYSSAANNYCVLDRYITVSWNKEETAYLYEEQGKENDSNHWYQIWFSYMDTNGDVIDFNGKNLTTGEQVNGGTAQRIMHSISSVPEKTTYIIPRLDGKGTISGGGITVKPYAYFKIGYTINFYGEGQWQGGYYLAVKPKYLYNTNGLVDLIENNQVFFINSKDTSPILYSHPSINNWKANSKFYRTEDYYFSPTDGLRMFSNWNNDKCNLCPTVCNPFKQTCDNAPDTPTHDTAVRKVDLYDANMQKIGVVSIGDQVDAGLVVILGMYVVTDYTTGQIGFSYENPLISEYECPTDSSSGGSVNYQIAETSAQLFTLPEQTVVGIVSPGDKIQIEIVYPGLYYITDLDTHKSGYSLTNPLVSSSAGCYPHYDECPYYSIICPTDGSQCPSLCPTDGSQCPSLCPMDGGNAMSGIAQRQVGLWSGLGGGQYKGGVWPGDQVSVTQEQGGCYYIINHSNGAEGWGVYNPLSISTPSYCFTDGTCQANTSYSEIGQNTSTGTVLGNNTYIVDANGNLVTYAQQGETFTIYGEMKFPGGDTVYYDIGGGRYISHNAVSVSGGGSSPSPVAGCACDSSVGYMCNDICADDLGSCGNLIYCSWFTGWNSDPLCTAKGSTGPICSNFHG